MLSLDETTLDAIDGTKTVPILVPKPHGDLASLVRQIGPDPIPALARLDHRERAVTKSDA